MWAVWKTYGPGEQNPHEGPMMFTISKQTKAAFEKQMTTDFENRLVQVTTPTQVVTYAYDPFGRRISKKASVGLFRRESLAPPHTI